MLLKPLWVRRCSVNFWFNIFFSDEEMDGAALVQTFASSPGPDCLKSVVRKFGVRTSESVHHH